MAKIEKTSSMQIEPIEVTADGGEYYSMNDIDMVELEFAETIEDYHAQLSQIIKKIRGFNDEELDRLAELVFRPWKRRRGRPDNKLRDVRILEKHFVRKEGEPRTPRKIAIEQIQKEHRLGYEAALSIYKRLSGVKKNRKKEK